MEIQRGFPHGDDAFDAVVGLFGMLQVCLGQREPGGPDDRPGHPILTGSPAVPTFYFLQDVSVRTCAGPAPPGTSPDQATPRAGRATATPDHHPRAGSRPRHFLTRDHRWPHAPK